VCALCAAGGQGGVARNANDGSEGRGFEAEVNRLERLREEEVLRLEEDLLRKLEEKLTPLLYQAAHDAAKKAMHQLRLEMMEHISRQEKNIRHLKNAEAAVREVPTSKVL